MVLPGFHAGSCLRLPGGVGSGRGGKNREAFEATRTPPGLNPADQQQQGCGQQKKNAREGLHFSAFGKAAEEIRAEG